METTTIVGAIASVLTTLSFLPQLFKMIRTKKAQDISYYMLAVLFAGGILWIVYGTLKADWIIIISNCVSTLINIVSSFFSFKYKNKEKNNT
jgi:MtN3 and saliva related transmembrane protein